MEDEALTSDNAVTDMLASMRRRVSSSRLMVAWSLARVVVRTPGLSVPEAAASAGACSWPVGVLLDLLESPRDLDVLMFAHRHPRALLGIDHLARAVGHGIDDVRASIERLTAAGLVSCAKPAGDERSASVLFYQFMPGAWDAILPVLLWVASAPDGRRVLRHALRSRRARVANELHSSAGCLMRFCDRCHAEEAQWAGNRRSSAFSNG